MRKTKAAVAEQQRRKELNFPISTFAGKQKTDLNKLKLFYSFFF